MYGDFALNLIFSKINVVGFCNQTGKIARIILVIWSFGLTFLASLKSFSNLVISNTFCVLCYSTSGEHWIFWLCFHKSQKKSLETLHISFIQQEWRKLSLSIHISSLNKIKRQRELLRITHENLAILKRITTKDPHYNHKRWLFEWQVSWVWKTTVLYIALGKNAASDQGLRCLHTGSLFSRINMKNTPNSL